MRTKDSEKLKLLGEYVKDYAYEHNGKTPSLGDIMEYTGMTKATAYRYMRTLAQSEEFNYNGKNTLEVSGERYSRNEVKKLPILGAIPCGNPEKEEEYIEGYLSVPEIWCRGECFLLRTYGDSMADIGINEGDLVLVKKSDFAESGQVVVALTEEGNTLKRFRLEEGKAVLYAENRTYPQNKRRIEPKELSIQGIALKLIKDII